MKKLYLLVVLIMAISGCGGGGGGGEGSSETTTILEGTWLKACSSNNSADPLYDIVTITFTNNNYVSKGDLYTDSGCTIADSTNPTSTLSGTIAIGSELTTTGGLQANEINAHTDTLNGAVYDDDSFTIFKITGNILYFGDDSGVKDATTLALRPDKLDFIRIFDRQ